MAVSIEFAVRRPLLEGFSEQGDEEEASPYVSLKYPEMDIEDLQDADEIDIDKPSIRVAASYPLSREFLFKVSPPSEAASFTRAGLVKAISTLYHNIYNEETRTSSIAAGQLGNMFNRNTTTGKLQSGSTALA